MGDGACVCPSPVCVCVCVVLVLLLWITVYYFEGIFLCVYAFVLYCITFVLFLCYSVALCEALKTYMDLRYTDTILND